MLRNKLSKEKVCIVYDIKRGAMEQIATWMMEELKGFDEIKVEMKRPFEISNFDYDLFIVGSPIYWEKLMNVMIQHIILESIPLKQ